VPRYGMTARLALSLAMALAYAAFFELEKHLPVLAAANPFLGDPYDAFGSIALETAGGLAVLVLVRAVHAWSAGARDARAAALLLRSEVGLGLAIALGAAPDLVALARHRETWTTAPSGPLLATATVGILVAALAFTVIVLQARPAAPRRARSAAAALSLVVLSFGALTLYPEVLTAQIATHLLTILAAVVLYFGMLATMLVALVPLPPDPGAAAPSLLGRILRRSQWAIVSAGALAAGLAILAAQLGEGNAAPPPLAEMARVVGIYLGVEAAIVLVGYIALRRPLRLLD
jgi:hypothetical protein